MPQNFNLSFVLCHQPLTKDSDKPLNQVKPMQHLSSNVILTGADKVPSGGGTTRTTLHRGWSKMTSYSICIEGKLFKFSVV